MADEKEPTTPEFLRDLAERLHHVPGTFNIDGSDVDELIYVARQMEGKEPSAARVEVLFEYPLAEVGFGNSYVTYEGYKSNCREDHLALALTQLRLQLNKQGLTCGEWCRGMVAKLQQGLKERP